MIIGPQDIRQFVGHSEGPSPSTRDETLGEVRIIFDADMLRELTSRGWEYLGFFQNTIHMQLHETAPNGQYGTVSVTKQCPVTTTSFLVREPRGSALQRLTNALHEEYTAHQATRARLAEAEAKLASEEKFLTGVVDTLKKGENL